MQAALQQPLNQPGRALSCARHLPAALLRAMLACYKQPLLLCMLAAWLPHRLAGCRRAAARRLYLA